MGDRLKNIILSCRLIEQYIGLIKQKSSIYQTAAWGIEEQPYFLNQVLLVETISSASDCLEKILLIENIMGRIRTEKNAPRIIDIDILFYNHDQIATKSLTIPHPEIQNRRFVLTPLNEIAPSFIHPVLQKSITDLLVICQDPLSVSRILKH